MKTAISMAGESHNAELAAMNVKFEQVILFPFFHLNILMDNSLQNDLTHQSKQLQNGALNKRM